MLSLLFAMKRKAGLEDVVLSIQNGDEQLLETTLKNYHPFIKKTVSSVCKRYIDQSDDEFSIGLLAFHDAIFKYDVSKGASLLAFAELMIKRRVIDYIRQQARHSAVSLDQGTGADEEESDYSMIVNSLSAENYTRELEADARREEILSLGQELEQYGLTFEDLAKHSPKHEDARVSAMKIARIVADDETLFAHLRVKRKLPVKELEKQVSVSRKTIERNRKYIIAICVILAGDFVFLQEYIKGRGDSC